MKQISYIVIGLALVGIFFTGWKFAKTTSENDRLRKNVAEMQNENQGLTMSLSVKNRELRELLEGRFPALERKLDSAKIRSSTIEKIVVQKVIYRDTSVVKTNLQPIVEAVDNRISTTFPFVDKSPCLTIKGKIEFDGEDLSLSITDREFLSINEAVSHWERRQWKFLFIKSRLFGRKELKVTVFNNCGESKTIIVNKN